MSFLFSRPSFCEIYLEHVGILCQDRKYPGVIPKYPGVIPKYPEVLLGSEKGPSSVSLPCTETKETSEGASPGPIKKTRAYCDAKLARLRNEVS
jgi:hypothetical protein